MKQKYIDASREARLWLRDIILPGIGIAMMFPEAREAAKAKASEWKQKIEARIKK